MTNEISPLPCPFCGETTVNVHEGSSFRWRVAECGACSAQAPEVRVQTLGSGTPEQWDTQGHADAIKAWNTRAAPVEPNPPRDSIFDQADRLIEALLAKNMGTMQVCHHGMRLKIDSWPEAEAPEYASIFAAAALGSPLGPQAEAMLTAILGFIDAGVDELLVRRIWDEARVAALTMNRGGKPL